METYFVESRRNNPYAVNYPTTSLNGRASLIHLHPPSSGTNGPKTLSSLVLLDIYWTHKWYISVLPKIYQLTFSAAPPPPPFFPVPCNHPLTGFKLGRINATYLQRMLWSPPLNVVNWGHPFETPRYTEVKIWWRDCVNPEHHEMSLVQVGAMYREVFGQ